MAKWQKTQFTGVEFYQHETRKHGVKFDCYYRGRFTFRGETYSSGFGWGSEGWTPSKAFAKLQSYRHNAKAGKGPTTFKAEQALREAKQAKQEEQDRISAKLNVTFSEFFETEYVPIEKQNVKERTLDTQQGHYTFWLKPVVGKLTFKEIKPFYLERVKKNMLKAGKSPRTIQNCFATFRQTWNTARLQDLINEDTPTRDVKIPKFDNKRVRFLSHEEAELLLAELKRRSTQLYDMSLLALYTGLRASELFNLTWRDVDLENGLLTIRDSKNTKTRYAYLMEKTKAMLKGLQNKDCTNVHIDSISLNNSGNENNKEISKGLTAKNEFVFRDRNGHKIKEISNAFGEAVKALKLNEGVTDRRQRVCFHSLRHTFASWHVQAGTDLYTVKELLGHSSIQLTERYSHLRKEGLQQAVKEFDKKWRHCPRIKIAVGA